MTCTSDSVYSVVNMWIILHYLWPALRIISWEFTSRQGQMADYDDGYLELALVTLQFNACHHLLQSTLWLCGHLLLEFAVCEIIQVIRWFSLHYAISNSLWWSHFLCTVPQCHLPNMSMYTCLRETWSGNNRSPPHWWIGSRLCYWACTLIIAVLPTNDIQHKRTYWEKWVIHKHKITVGNSQWEATQIRQLESSTLSQPLGLASLNHSVHSISMKYISA